MTDPNIVIRAVNTARDSALALREAARTRRRGHSEPVTGSAPDAPAPLNLDMFDQAEMIHYCVQGWARIVEEDQGDPLPADDTAALATYLLHHTGWISEQDWAEDMVSELRDHTHTAEGMLGTLPRRIPLPTPCECGAQRWGFPVEGQGGMIVECAQGHAVTLAQAGGSPTLVSIRGAQKVLGIRRTDISDAVRTGQVTNHGTEDRPLVNTQEIEEVLRDRLRNRYVC